MNERWEKKGKKETKSKCGDDFSFRISSSSNTVQYMHLRRTANEVAGDKVFIFPFSVCFLLLSPGIWIVSYRSSSRFITNGKKFRNTIAAKRMSFVNTFIIFSKMSSMCFFLSSSFYFRFALFVSLQGPNGIQPNDFWCGRWKHLCVNYALAIWRGKTFVGRKTVGTIYN